MATGITFLIVRAQSPVSSCYDLDSHGCELFQKANPELCQDSQFSMSSCQLFCGKCPLECYSCPNATRDITECNHTMACGPNMKCMKKQLVAKDGHHEYILSCERHEICEGLTFGFGKRDLNDVTELEPPERHRFERDVSVSCCDTDFCNHPSKTPPTTSPQPATSQQPTTHQHGHCYKDIVFAVDHSVSVGNYNFRHLLEFVRYVVSHITVGPDNAQIAFMCYSTSPQIEWYLNQHSTNTGVTRALNHVNCHSGVTLAGSALKAVRTEILTPQHGDRPYADNVVIMLGDGQYNDDKIAAQEATLLHTVSKDVINVAVSNNIDKTKLSAIATDNHHVIGVHGYSELFHNVHNVAHLICS